MKRIAIVCWLFALQANAATIVYDESIQGDWPTTYRGGYVTLAPGENIFKGTASLQTGQPSDSDFIYFRLSQINGMSTWIESARIKFNTFYYGGDYYHENGGVVSQAVQETYLILHLTKWFPHPALSYPTIIHHDIDTQIEEDKFYDLVGASGVAQAAAGDPHSLYQVQLPTVFRSERGLQGLQYFIDYDLEVVVEGMLQPASLSDPVPLAANPVPHSIVFLLTSTAIFAIMRRKRRPYGSCV